MKSKYIFFLVFYTCCSLFIIQNNAVAEWMILFFYPECSYAELKDKTCSFGKKSIGGAQYEGIYATHGGKIAISDDAGQIRFMRTHQEKVGPLRIVVTQRIKPIFVSGKTINHFVVDALADYSLYVLNKIKDPKDNKSFWEVHKEELPKTRIIPYNAIIIFARPDHVHIQLGKSHFTEGSQLILPKIYISDSVTHDLSALQVIAIRQFFAPLVRVYQPGIREVAIQLFS